MDLFDWFFPVQAQASHMRRLADAQARTAAHLRGSAGSAEEVESLARENRELRLYLTAITQLLVEKRIVRADEIQAKVLAMLPPLPMPSQGTAQEEDNPFADLG